MKRNLWKALPHLCVPFSIAALALTVVDGVNSQMGFLSSTPGRIILIVASALSAINAARTILRGDY